MTKPLVDAPVLLTGASGFVGANLANRLVSEGVAVHAIVRKTSDPWRINSLGSNLFAHYGDLRDVDFLNAVIKEVRPRYVLHGAAESGLYTDYNSRMEAMDSALRGTANLLEVLTDSGIARLVFLGSSLEYGQWDGPLQEKLCPRPVCFRGVLKNAQTLLCRQFGLSTGKEVVCLRLFSVYGPYEPPRRFIPQAICAALGGKTLPLTLPGFRHDFIFVEDVVDACLLVLEKECGNSEIFNIASGIQTTNEEVVQLIEELTGREIKTAVGEFPTKQADTTHWLADIGKARKVLGWEPRFSLKSGLAKTIEWIKSSGLPQYEY